MNINRDHDDLDPKLAERFHKLRVIPPRNPERTTAGRAAFLSQARDLALKSPPPVPVSPSPGERLILWMRAIPEFFTRKEIQPMFTKVMAVLIAAVLVFGGAAATAYASQASLPTDALYGVKTFGENIRISLAPQADDKLGLALEFSQRRVDEMAALNQLNMNIPEHVATQYQEQVEYTLRLAAGLPDNQIIPALEQVRTRLQEQLRTMDQLHQANQDDPELIRAREQLREQLRLAEDGLQDPQRFREQVRERERQRLQTQKPASTDEPSATVAPGSGNTNSNANANQNANANGNTNGNLNRNENGNANSNMNGNGNENANGNMNGNGNGNENDDDTNGNDDGGGGNSNDDGGGRGGNDDGGGRGGNDDGGGGNDNGGGGNDDGGGGNGNGHG
jgi:uncharacterized membrane protein YgcG